MDVHKTALVGHTAENMFDLIEAAENYPGFLPWCAHATIIERTDEIVRARIGINWHGVKFEFTTRNPKRRPEWMAIDLEQGPFRDFHGEWHLKPLAVDACKIEFDLRYDFASPIMRKVAGPVFERLADTLVDAFVARAAIVFAHAPAAAAAPATGAAPAAAPAPLAAPAPATDPAAATAVPPTEPLPKRNDDDPTRQD